MTATATELRPLEVIPTGDLCCYYVRSETTPSQVYRVDLLYNGGIGGCHCGHFRTRLAPRIRDGKLTLEDTFPRHPDKHLQACRDAFFRDLLVALAKQETEQL